MYVQNEEEQAREAWTMDKKLHMISEISEPDEGASESTAWMSNA